MHSATQWLLVFAPFIVFAVVFAIGFFGIFSFARSLKLNFPNGVHNLSNKEVHLRTALGSVDVHPSASLDPRLANILIYPGAAPLEPGVSQYESEFHVMNREVKAITAQYWTTTPEQIVREFYQRELPEWQVNQKREFIKEADGYTQAVAVHAVGDRTIIDTAIRVLAMAGTTRS